VSRLVVNVTWTDLVSLALIRQPRALTGISGYDLENGIIM
jgi:hypothetical protein